MVSIADAFSNQIPRKMCDLCVDWSLIESSMSNVIAGIHSVSFQNNWICDELDIINVTISNQYGKNWLCTWKIILFANIPYWYFILWCHCRHDSWKKRNDSVEPLRITSRTVISWPCKRRQYFASFVDSYFSR